MDEQDTTEISVLGDVQGWLCTAEGKKKIEGRMIDGRTVFDLGTSAPWEMRYFIAKK